MFAINLQKSCSINNYDEIGKTYIMTTSKGKFVPTIQCTYSSNVFPCESQGSARVSPPYEPHGLVRAHPLLLGGPPLPSWRFLSSPPPRFYHCHSTTYKLLYYLPTPNPILVPLSATTPSPPPFPIRYWPHLQTIVPPLFTGMSLSLSLIRSHVWISQPLGSTSTFSLDQGLSRVISSYHLPPYRRRHVLHLSRLHRTKRKIRQDPLLLQSANCFSGQPWCLLLLCIWLPSSLPQSFYGRYAPCFVF